MGKELGGWTGGWVHGRMEGRKEPLQSGTRGSEDQALDFRRGPVRLCVLSDCPGKKQTPAQSGYLALGRAFSETHVGPWNKKGAEVEGRLRVVCLQS